MNNRVDQTTIFVRSLIGALLLIAMIVFLSQNLGRLHLQLSGIGLTDLRKLETNLRLPAGSAPLNSYKRFYFLAENGTLMGVFVLNPPEAGIFPILRSSTPMILDGGCDVINVELDRSRNHAERIFCNGKG